MSWMQRAGRKNSSPIDHIVTLNATIENQRVKQEHTYVLFADAEKCFDRLWLKDGILEIGRCGWSNKDLMMPYRINETADIIVKTPVGETAEFTVKNIVKRRTMHGPVICCAGTSKVNGSEETVEYIYGQVTIGIPVFMDDIMSAGSHADVTKIVKNCREMEETK